MGATANSFPLAAGNFAAVFSIMLDQGLATRDSKTQFEDARICVYFLFDF